MSARPTAPFGSTSTSLEVVDGVDLHGRRAVVTGAASGIGVETARALAAAGADVTIAVRNLGAGARVAQDITSEATGRRVHVAPLDLTDQASVAAFVDAWDGPLDILVNNAGVMAAPETRTSEGWELQFATNHLGHFALALGLQPHLAAADGARVVVVSSSAHLQSPVVFDDIHYRERPYDPWSAYAQSKTANVLFAIGAAERWADEGIAVNALHPGGILTDLSRHLDPSVIQGYLDDPDVHFKSPQQGAATSVMLAASPLLEGVSGRYFEDCQEARRVDAAPGEDPGWSGVAAHALDRDAADRLWDLSTQHLG